MNSKNKIVVTGGSGRFAISLKKTKSKYRFIYPNKKQLNITKIKSIENYLKKNKPKSVLHLAGLSRPMIEHEKKIKKSISLNIIGTSNLVKICSDLKIKLVYFSTSYVYPGKKGDYKEKDPLLPWNNYAWSKLGGECAVQMYKNSLILRVCMTEKPFVHKKAFANVKLNFIFHSDLAKILIKLLDKKGVINVGGRTKTVYNFAKKYNPKVKKIFINKKKSKSFALNPSMNLNKLNKILKN
jgi:dTDP-4-dehydrorhamnose reductase